MVDDDSDFRELSADVALDADIQVLNLSTDELDERRAAELPDGVCWMAHG